MMFVVSRTTESICISFLFPSHWRLAVRARSFRRVKCQNYIFIFYHALSIAVGIYLLLNVPTAIGIRQGCGFIKWIVGAQMVGMKGVRKNYA